MADRSYSFLSRDDPETLIVYGLVSEPARVLAELQRAEDPAPLTGRYALLAPNTDGLRLSSPGWIDVTFDLRMALTDPADLFQLARQKILRGVSPFARPTRRFLEAYLDFVWVQTEIHKEELAQSAPSDELFSPEDWVFSAWLPLPQARILLPSEFESDGPEFAEIDVAFWLDGRIKAVVIETTNTPIPSKQRRLDYLRDNHPFLDIVSVPRDGAFPANAFPPAFGRFWEGLALPTGLGPPKI